MSLSAERQDLNWAIRLAFAVTLGLTIETWREALLPPLAPVLALQLLAASRVPPGGRMVVLLLLVTAATSGLAYLVSVLTVGYTGLYVIGVGLLYLWGFALALRKGTALIGILAITMTIVVTGLASTSTSLAFSIAVSLVTSVVQAFVLVYLAHALFPEPALRKPEPKAAQQRARSPLPTALRALLATVVILPAHVYLNTDGVASMVVLITMATMLRQPGIAQSTRYCIAFVSGNALGAFLAAAAVLVLTLQDHAAVMISVTAAGALILSWQLLRGGQWVAVIIPGYVAYTVLFGFVLSPLPLADSVAAIDRVAVIIAGGIYAMAAVSLLIPVLPYLTRLSRAKAA